MDIAYETNIEDSERWRREGNSLTKKVDPRNDRVIFFFLPHLSRCEAKEARNGEKGTLVHCWWECKLVQPLWKTVWKFL